MPYSFGVPSEVRRAMGQSLRDLCPRIGGGNTSTASGRVLCSPPSAGASAMSPNIRLGALGAGEMDVTDDISCFLTIECRRGLLAPEMTSSTAPNELFAQGMLGHWKRAKVGAWWGAEWGRDGNTLTLDTVEVNGRLVIVLLCRKYP